MKFFVKLAAVLLLVCFCLTAVTCLAAMMMKPVIDRKIERLVRESARSGFEISHFDYGKFKLWQLGFILNDVQVNGVTRFEHPYFDPREFELRVKHIQFGFRPVGWGKWEAVIRIFGFDARGGRLLHEDRDDHERLESISKVNAKTSLVLKGHPDTWAEQIKERLKTFKAWVFEDGKLDRLEVRGSAVFLVDDWPIRVRLFTVADQEGYVHLEANPEDLRVIAEMIEPKFTDSDLKLASKNLTKMPKLLHIRREAEMKSIKLSGRDKTITYDTFRHIFWSYWMTQAYGPEFARETTDAHEIGDLTNSAAESSKDRHHNALGIEYALNKLTEAQVEKKIFEDPRIIRLKPKTRAAQKKKV